MHRAEPEGEPEGGGADRKAGRDVRSSRPVAAPADSSGSGEESESSSDSCDGPLVDWLHAPSGEDPQKQTAPPALSGGGGRRSAALLISAAQAAAQASQTLRALARRSRSAVAGEEAGLSGLRLCFQIRLIASEPARRASLGLDPTASPP